AQHRLVCRAVDDADAWPPVVLLEWTNRVVARILEQLSLQIEHRGLAVDLGRRKVERVAEPGADRQAIRDAPVVLNEVLLEPRAFLDVRLLQVDREGLDLSEQKTRERRAGVRGSRLIAEQVAEHEVASRKRRLHDVEPLPSPIETHLQ